MESRNPSLGKNRRSTVSAAQAPRSLSEYSQRFGRRVRGMVQSAGRDVSSGVAAMTDKRFRGWDVDQTWLLPPSLHDFVPAGHSAHVVRDAVRETLDLSAILEACKGTRGQPPCHPAMMTALLLYACSCGVHSSRRSARGCEERLDFMAVTGLQRPDFRTVSDFRKRHLKALGGLFDQVPGCAARRVWRGSAMSRWTHQGQGQRVEAQGDELRPDGCGRGRSRGRDRGVAGARGTGGCAEDAAQGRDRRGDEMPSWVADKQKRLARIRAAKAALEAKAEAEAKAKAGAEAAARVTAEAAAGDGAAAGQGPAQLHRPREPDPQDRGRLHPGLQRAGGG